MVDSRVATLFAERLGGELKVARVHRADRRRLAKRERVVADVVRLAGDVVHRDRRRVVEQVAHRVEVLARRQPAQRQQPGGVRIGGVTVPPPPPVPVAAPLPAVAPVPVPAPSRFLPMRRRRFRPRYPRQRTRRRRRGIRRHPCRKRTRAAARSGRCSRRAEDPRRGLAERRRAMKAVLTGMGASGPFPPSHAAHEKWSTLSDTPHAGEPLSRPDVTSDHQFRACVPFTRVMRNGAMAAALTDSLRPRRPPCGRAGPHDATPTARRQRARAYDRARPRGTEAFSRQP